MNRAVLMPEHVMKGSGRKSCGRDVSDPGDQVEVRVGGDDFLDAVVGR
jgi:hypothetical protein